MFMELEEPITSVIDRQSVQTWKALLELSSQDEIKTWRHSFGPRIPNFRLSTSKVTSSSTHGRTSSLEKAEISLFLHDFTPLMEEMSWLTIHGNRYEVILNDLTEYLYFRPIKVVWHGADRHGIRHIEGSCDAWNSNSRYKNGFASNILRGKLLDQEKIPCNSLSILLCVEISSNDDGNSRSRRSFNDSMSLDDDADFGYWVDSAWDAYPSAIGD